jgi:hypothetical protein
MTSMTAAVLDRPDSPAASGADDDRCHLYCCNENVALCGTDLTDYEDDCGDPGHVICPLCALADAEGLRCPVPGCRGGDGDA